MRSHTEESHPTQSYKNIKRSILVDSVVHMRAREKEKAFQRQSFVGGYTSRVHLHVHYAGVFKYQKEASVRAINGLQ